MQNDLARLEVGKAYSAVGDLNIYLVTEVRSDGYVMGNRYVRSQARFSGSGRVIAGGGFGPPRQWEEVDNPTSLGAVWCKDDPKHGKHLWRRVGVQDRAGRLVVVSRCDDCPAERVRRWWRSSC